MELRKVAICSKCGKAIAFGETFGFVCFKIPGKEGYQFSGDCWERYLKERN